jgi:superfamily II DNA or RNA helicase
VQLRPYQVKFVESVESGWNNFRKQLGVAPTGAGKTIIFSWLAKRRFDSTGEKTLILAHREELIDQAISKLHAATGIIADKEKAEFNARHSSPVVVASVQTMIRRLEKWPNNHFGMVIADEAHHVLAGTWRTVLDHFAFADILGVTATPDRGDKKSLGQFFENIAYEISLKELIRDKYLCSIAIKSIPIKIDLTGVKSVAGDLDSGQLGHVLEPYLEQIAQQIKIHAGDRKTLAFLPLIGTSLKFVQHCRNAGISAEHIDGESPDRKEKLEAFARGDFQLLSNAMLLLEGYDCPAISCIAFLRPTRVRSLFAQGAGRGTRIFEGKDNLLLLDPLWLHSQHDIAKPASLISESDEEAQSITELAESGGGEKDLMALAGEAQAQREEALRKKLEALKNKKAKFISAEEFAVSHHQLEIAEFEPTMRWHSDAVTEAQAKYIEQAGVDVSTVKGKGQASLLLDTIFKERGAQPATQKQKWVMNQAGWRSEDNKRGPWQATQDDARKFFAAKNKAKLAVKDEVPF